MVLTFTDWKLSPHRGVSLGHQYDNLTSELTVQGGLPEGWEWDILVSAGGNGDTWHLTPGDGQASITLTEDNLSVSGEYYLQLRGIKGEQVRHTNIVTACNFRSLSGAGQWPTLPTEWIQAERDIKELNAHPPVPGEDGYWQLWDLTTHSYQPSQLVVPGLSIQAGTVTTLEPDQPATVKVVGDGPDYQVDFGIPQGKPGKNGKDGAPGKDGTDGTPGKDGQTPTITVGTVTTLDPGQDATAEITGETPNLTLNLGIPEGQPGQDGVQLNDDAINTTEAWSSKKIVDTLCPAFSVSGNPVTCNPVEDYPLSAVVTLEPKQAGTGDPSPENVRPISGYDSVKVTVSNEDESHDYTLTLPETIYGGTVDAVTGAGEKTWEFVEFDGTEKWNTWGPNSGADGVTGFYYYHSIDVNPLQVSMISSILLYNVRAYSGVVVGCSIGNPGNVNPYFIFSVSNSILSDVSSNNAAIESWKSYLAAQASAGTPVQVAYKLATPEPFQATGNQPIPALAGENTVYTDGNSLAVSGRKDPTQEFQSVQMMKAQLATMLGKTEEVV